MIKTMPRSQSPLQRLRILVICNLLNLTLINSAIAQPEQRSQLRTLTVTGSSVEKIAASIAEVELGVEIQDRTAEKVQQEIAKKTTAVVNLLRSQDVEQLQTTGVRLNPRYEQFDRNSNKKNITGYIGTNTVSFRIPTEQAGSLLDEAVAAGATRIDRISFTATTEAMATAKKEALRQATVDAQEQAETVLETLDLAANEVVKIEIDRANINAPQPYALGLSSRSDSQISTPIIGGEQTVQAGVTLQISY